MLRFGQYVNVEKALSFMEQRDISLLENVYRPLSESYFEFFREARRLYKEGKIQVSEFDIEIIESDLGEFAEFEEMSVPPDCPLVEAEYKGNEVELDKPKRGGPKKYYVYVKDPSTGNVKRIAWGDTSGLKVKINDLGARKSFAARHKCDTRNDKTTASYWACRLPMYAKSLNLQVDNPRAFW